MPRRPRLVLPGTPLHLIQRGNNRQACFYADADYQFYLEWLEKCGDKYGCQIHAYVLMTNHVHLLVTPGEHDSAGLMMKYLGQRYVQDNNRGQTTVFSPNIRNNCSLVPLFVIFEV